MGRPAAFGRYARVLLILVLPFLGLAACAPRLQQIGPPVAAPSLTADAIVTADGVALPLRVWHPLDRDGDGRPVAVILALHGFNDYSRAFESPALAWSRRGIATYAYDQRGFGATPQRGLWPGDQALIDDLRAAADLVAARHPGVPLYILGESMGGAVAAVAAASADPPACAGIILAAPAVWGRATQGPLQSGLLWLAAHSLPWLKLTGEGLNILPSDNLAMLRALGRDPLVIKETRVDTIYGLVGLMDRAWAAAPALAGPALLLYGAREQVIPEGAALAWLRRLPADPGAAAGGAAGGAPGTAPRVALYPRGYHMLLRDLAAGIVLADIAGWIADRQAPLGSGADALAARVIDGGAEDFAALRADPPAAEADAAPETAGATVAGD